MNRKGFLSGMNLCLPVRSLVFASMIVLAFSSGQVFAQAGPANPGPPDANPDLNPGDVVGEFDINTEESVNLAERNSTGAGMDCEELSNYYAYRNGRNEVRCERSGGPESCDFHCWEKRVQGCFVPETKILMDGGKTKPISMIRQGDMVWSPSRGQALPVKRIVRGPEAKPLFEIGYGEIATRVTETHPVVVGDSSSKSLFQRTSLGLPRASALPLQVRVKKANEITREDWILGADGEFHQVSTLRKLPVDPTQEVYNIELDTGTKLIKDHLLVADGVITGDYMVQSIQADK